jgi:serine/threonine-protein kinase HipA
MTIKTRRCPISYLPLEDDQLYSRTGLTRVARHLNSLEILPYSAQQQRQQALQRAGKMSIQGVQPKLSAILNIKQGRFELVDCFGKFILKPQSEYYPQLPENEDLTMRLAAVVGIEVPLHGLLYCQDGSLTYFIKRFDRVGHKSKLAVEDFAQLSGHSRETKYNFSMEKLIPIIENFCTFPAVEKKNLLMRTLFNYVVGNEDMHLKNFSLIRRDNKVTLAPAYDFVNSTIVLPHSKEALALPLRGKKRHLTFNDLIKYFAYQRLGLSQAVVEGIIQQLLSALPQWKDLIEHSFLNSALQHRYWQLLQQRIAVLGE